MPVLWQGFRPPDRVLDRHWIEIPYIHSDIDAVRAAIPVSMHVAEQMQRASAGVVPSYHRVVAERNRHVRRRVIYLGQPRHTVPWQCLRQRTIVVAHYEMPPCTRKLTEESHKPVLVFRLWPKSEVPYDPEIIFRADFLPQPLDQNRIHMRGMAERPPCKWDDALMPEMRVGCVPVGHLCGSEIYAKGVLAASSAARSMLRSIRISHLPIQYEQGADLAGQDIFPRRKRPYNGDSAGCQPRRMM